MPWKYVRGVQLSTGDMIEGRDWKPSGKHEDQKQELIHMMDEYLKEKDRQFKEHGFYTTTETLPRIEDWVDREFALAYQRGRSEALAEWVTGHGSWWSRNWILVLFFVILVGGMLTIGLVNGWS